MTGRLPGGSRRRRGHEAVEGAGVARRDLADHQRVEVALVDELLHAVGERAVEVGIVRRVDDLVLAQVVDGRREVRLVGLAREPTPTREQVLVRGRGSS